MDRRPGNGCDLGREARGGALKKPGCGDLPALACCIFLAVAVSRVDAQTAPRLYACRDGHGRTLTSDRPMAECAETTQQELRKSGGVLRSVGPTYSDLELAARQKQDRRIEEAVAERAGERRRARALLVRYPAAPVHDRERDDALRHLEQAAQTARHYLLALRRDRQRLDEELQFYRGDRAKAPVALREALEDNEARIRAQSKFIQSMDEDRQRLVERFATERAQLEPLWRAAAANR